MSVGFTQILIGMIWLSVSYPFIQWRMFKKTSFTLWSIQLRSYFVILCTCAFFCTLLLFFTNSCLLQHTYFIKLTAFIKIAMGSFWKTFVTHICGIVCSYSHLCVNGQQSYLCLL